MIWLSWRQFRLQAITAGVLLFVVVAMAVPTGLDLRHRFTAGGLANCTGSGSPGQCDALTSAFTANYGWLQTILYSIVILLMPAVIGVFWAAPLLAREFDTGTYRLAWTQSVTRGRWLAAKVFVVGAAGVITAGVSSWLVTWWSGPLDAVRPKFTAATFGERDLTPVGYTAFAFGLGLLAGAVLRRTLPAMACTLVAFIGIRIVVTLWVRPHFATARHASLPMDAPPNQPGGTVAPPGSWVLSQRIIDPTGHSISDVRISSDDSCAATRSCLTDYHQAITFQPSDRYWPFQWAELTLFLIVAVVLVALSFAVVCRTRRSRRQEAHTEADAPQAVGNGRLVPR